MSDAETMTLRRGSLYFDAALHERHFAGLETLVLLRRGACLAILPVRHAASGGYLIKRRNAAGDRVVSAPDFFRAQGLADDAEIGLQLRWSDEEAALVSNPVFTT
jgi:hypothetical protein